MKGPKLFLLSIALIEWFALIAQLVLHVQTVPEQLAESIMRFFSYFTILTNILVAVFATVLVFSPAKSAAGFFFRVPVQTAITLYITVVGLIYNIVLRQLWDSSGLQAVLHDLLHTLIPLMMLIYWWVWVSTRKLQYQSILGWLVFPAVYAIAVIARGNFAEWYPYPFLDVGKFGYQQVAINSVILIAVFLVFSFLFVFLGRKKGRVHST